MEFWAYYRILRRRRWLLVAALLAAVAVAFAANRPAVGDFEASANLSAPLAQRFVFISGLSESKELAGNRTALALDLVQSRDVAERVVQRYNLNMRPEELQRRLKAEKDPVTNLIRVTVTGKTPAEAVGLTNAVAETAAAYDQELQRREATLAREFVEKQAEGMATSLRGAEDALLAFQQKNGVAMAMPVNSQVASLEAQAQQTDLSLLEVDARLASLRAQRTGGSDQEIADNPIAQQLRAQLVQLEVALTGELAVHTEQHPTVLTIKARIEAIKNRLNAELRKGVSADQDASTPTGRNRINLEAEKVALQARKEALQRALNRSAQALPESAQRQIEQSRLIRTVEILGKEFSSIQTQVTDARLKEQEVQILGSLAVADRARSARSGPFRGLQFKLTLASVLGLLGGVGLAFFQEYLDVTLRTAENAERLLGLPALVAIPQHNPPFDEAYRLLRVNLDAQQNGEGGGAIVVTAPKPGEGASTVVANLARAFARAGRRTIVVDAALRQPVQHVRFGVTNRKGLAEVLRGEAALEDVLVQTAVPNLSVLPSGVLLEGTEELLGSRAMTGVLAGLKQRGDVILVDTPAAGAFTDAFAMAPLASGVLLVLDARRRAHEGAAEQVKSQFARLGAKVLGIAVTKVRPDLVDSYVFQGHLNTPKRRWMPSRTAVTSAGVLILIVALGVLAGFSVKAAQNTGILSSIWSTAAQVVSVTAHHLGELLTAIEHVVAQWLYSTLPALVGWALGGRAP